MNAMKKRKWRVNVAVGYYLGVDPRDYREPIQSILYGVAWLYKLDFSKLLDQKEPSDESLCPDNERYTYDMYFYRSTSNTCVSAKHIRELIQTVFSGSDLLDYGVDVFCLTQKAYSKYPFPDEFLRPLAYPHIESYNGRRKTQLINAGWILEVVQMEQDFRLN